MPKGFDSNKILDVYNQIADEGTLVFYQGAVYHNILTEIAESIKVRINDTEKVKGKLFAVFVELAQNIRDYSSEKVEAFDTDRGVGVGIISIFEREDSYILHATNKIKDVQKTGLLLRCKHINSLSKEGLVEYYREQRRESQTTRARGGNIGLIDIVRRTGNPILVNDVPIKNGVSFLSVSVTINKH